MAKSKKSKKAKKSGSKKSGRKPMSAAAKKAFAARMKKARAAAKAKRSAAARKAAKTRAGGKPATPKKKKKKSAKKKSAKKHAAPKKHSKKRAAPKKSSRSKKRGHNRQTIARKGGGASAKVDVALSVRGPQAGPAKRKGGSKKRKGGSKRKSRAREGFAMENPLNGVEIFVGGLTMLAGFAAADVLDRFLATHALVESTLKPGQGLYGDQPPADGSYKGLYNATAVLAPMDMKRWGAGVALSAVPLIAAHFIKSPVGRSAVQMFGFGAGARVVGKGLQDLFAMAFKKTSVGQRLYDGEMRAAALKAGDGSEANLPTAGLGAPELGTGCGCPNCITGVGACCAARGGNPLPPQSTPTKESSSTVPASGAPTMVREPAGPIASPLTNAAGAGAPKNGAATRPGKFNWGSEDAA